MERMCQRSTGCEPDVSADIPVCIYSALAVDVSVQSKLKAVRREQRRFQESSPASTQPDREKTWADKAYYLMPEVVNSVGVVSGLPSLSTGTWLDSMDTIICQLIRHIIPHCWRTYYAETCIHTDRFVVLAREWFVSAD